MKKYYTILLLVCSIVTFAQGIAVQGIARDNTNAAITDTNLTFTFSVTENDNTVQYSETQSIKTDNFGVFSHILSSGNPATNTFDDIDFSIPDLKLKVFVDYNNSNIEVYNQTLNYTPYAHHANHATHATNAGDGVPTGAIMPFLGTADKVPAGWVLCNGDTLPSGDEYDDLKELLGTNKAPDLQGAFLRGAGSQTFSGTTYSAPANPGVFQKDVFKEHVHSAGGLNTNNTGAHKHKYDDAFIIVQDSKKSKFYPTIEAGAWKHYSSVNDNESSKHHGQLRGRETTSTGNHKHTISGNTGKTGSVNETRPFNYSVNYIIKL